MFPVSLFRRIIAHRYCAYSTTRTPTKDWNTKEEFFRFSRGQFITKGNKDASERQVYFDMNELARVAASAVSANQCIDIQKCPDGMYNKSYIFTMDDGRQVIGKVPNPNAGVKSLTTASEVATMDFARNILGAPVPHVYAWKSQILDNAVGAEYIIMEKASGIQLSHIWNRLKLTERLDIAKQLFHLQKKLLSAQLTAIGSLYYTADLDSRLCRPCSYVEPGGKELTDQRFVIGPLTGRDWVDQGRSNVQCERGPFRSVDQYYEAVLLREIEATQNTKHLPNQMVMICCPGLYLPTREKKLVALQRTQRIAKYLPPSDPRLCGSYLWHNDLHEENIFVDSDNPTTIVSIIDWQSTQATPLFEQILDPSILDFEGLTVDSLEKPSLPDNLSELSAEEKALQLRLYHSKALLVAYRRLAQTNALLKAAAEFQASAAFSIIKLSRRIFEIGEAHVQSMIAELQADWDSLPRVCAAGKPTFPLHLTQADLRSIENDAEAADVGIEAMDEMKRRMGKLWPDKGVTHFEHYEQTKKMLEMSKNGLVRELKLDEAEKQIFEEFWSFES